MSTTKQRSKGKISRSAGRFGPRYGRFIRKRVVEVEEISRATHACPSCDQVAPPSLLTSARTYPEGVVLALITCR